MSGIWLTILGFVNGAISLFNKALDWVKELKFVNYGRELQQAEDAKREAQITRETSEILAEDRTKEQTAKRMDEGTF
jgi:hypothetical protein